MAKIAILRRFTKHSTSFPELCEVDENGRIKLLVDTGSSNIRCAFQKVKHQKRGDVVKWYGEMVELIEIKEG